MKPLIYLIILMTPLLSYPQQPTPRKGTGERGKLSNESSQANERSGTNKDKRQGNSMREAGTFATDVPPHPYDVIMGSVTHNSAVISVNPYAKYDYYILLDGKQYPGSSHINITGLAPDTEYSFQLWYAPWGEANYTPLPTYTFRTQRAATQPFGFTITADAHLDQNTDTAALRKVMQAIAAERPDFHIDLGDTFMTEKYGNNYQASAAQYLAMRYYFGLIRTPLYLAVGNHDAAYQDKNPAMYQWAQEQRNHYFPTPGNYYAFEWGNTLFVVLDPYANTPRQAGQAPQLRTLGSAQLAWLKQTLQQSTARYKLIFVHSLVGGVDLAGRDRGGVEAAHLHEWGQIIHPLLVANKVSAVFKGHDHVFVHQELDGIVYQTLPQPAAHAQGKQHPEAVNEHAARIAHEYGYQSGQILGGSGYLSVKVSEQGIVVDYKSNSATVLQYHIK